ncbi:hypothetical protein BN7_3584 [Wickerhamomyces ciferrii]|uniref:Uncharacterized protein n=1 Tax=Wickerhamomyces ciferrii (strain ATCC 14091 / BCRC 22168 / CBS 111 / JCM 3599 / NBRC 0793 / NRRL Y-1031 F-60-10) TaxID=1206466 RepID=K0KPA7_WICCF|nr:uncharacterized protein BN7_3584 [Wickerhamomyces ciferrii]CCH44027.1 hypothetical protein BN7_3584 [Wickerhamomyces ciferrii]
MFSMLKIGSMHSDFFIPILLFQTIDTDYTFTKISQFHKRINKSKLAMLNTILLPSLMESDLFNFEVAYFQPTDNLKAEIFNCLMKRTDLVLKGINHRLMDNKVLLENITQYLEMYLNLRIRLMNLKSERFSYYSHHDITKIFEENTVLDIRGENDNMNLLKGPDENLENATREDIILDISDHFISQNYQNILSKYVKYFVHGEDMECEKCLDKFITKIIVELEVLILNIDSEKLMECYKMKKNDFRLAISFKIEEKITSFKSLHWSKIKFIPLQNLINFSKLSPNEKSAIMSILEAPSVNYH